MAQDHSQPTEVQLVITNEQNPDGKVKAAEDCLSSEAEEDEDLAKITKVVEPKKKSKEAETITKQEVVEENHQQQLTPQIPKQKAKRTNAPAKQPKSADDKPKKKTTKKQKAA